MIPLDIKKLFVMNSSYDKYSSLIINQEDIRKIGTRIPKPVMGFKAAAQTIVEPFLEMNDGTVILFPDVPENHAALATMSEFYKASQIVDQIQELASVAPLSRRETSELKKAYETMLMFHKTYG